jgi:hypothetical protein
MEPAADATADWRPDQVRLKAFPSLRNVKRNIMRNIQMKKSRNKRNISKSILFSQKKKIKILNK